VPKVPESLRSTGFIESVEFLAQYARLRVTSGSRLFLALALALALNLNPGLVLEKTD
jgi:hypothetical protein